MRIAKTLITLGAVTLTGVAALTGCSSLADESPAQVTYTMEDAENMLVHYFGEWGYPETETVRNGVKELLSNLRPGCTEPDDFLDRYVPGYVNSFNRRIGPTDLPLSESQVRWALESAIVVVCQPKE